MVDLPLPDATPAPEADDGAARQLAERVRAWQHRHPLARRIAPSEVVGLGVIALPYGPGLQGETRALFNQPKLLPGLSQHDLLAFADRHAVRERPGPAHWPQRNVKRSDAPAEAALETRYLLTAAIGAPEGSNAQPHRLLIAPNSPTIWGSRPWSRSRLAAAGLALLLVVVLLAASLRVARPSVGEPARAASTSGAAVAPVPPASKAPAPVPTAPAASLAAPAPGAAPASAAPSAAATPASAPALPAAPRLLPMPQPASAASAPPSAIPGPHYALVSAPAKKREEAEATLARVRQLLGPAVGPLQLQVMPSPEGFVVTIWPLPTGADAERLAEVLARRGVPMKWLEF